ncbi:MAG: hypothetical protein WBC83_02125 [Minisyncoccia bacterium]
MFTTKNLFKLIGKQLLISLGFVVFAFITVFIVSDQISKMSKKAIKDRNTATTLSEQTSLLSSLKYEASIIGSNDQVIKHAFIPSNNILEFIAILESLALKNGITQTFSFSSPNPAIEETPLPISMINYQNNISSNIFTFIKYLKEFEQLPYFTRINSISISSGSADWRTSSNVTFSASVAAQVAQ